MFATPFLHTKLRLNTDDHDDERSGGDGGELDLVAMRDTILQHMPASVSEPGGGGGGGRRFSTRGGWHSGQVQEWGGSSFAPLWATLLHHVTQASILEMSGSGCSEPRAPPKGDPAHPAHPDAGHADREQKERTCPQTSHRLSISLYTWANVLLPGGYNVLHTHNSAKNTHASPGEWSGVAYIDVGGVDPHNPDSGAFEYFDPRGDRRSSLYPDSLFIQPENATLLLFPPYTKHMVHPYTGDRVRTSVSFNAKVEMVEAVEPGDPQYGQPSFGVCVNCGPLRDGGEGEAEGDGVGDGVGEGGAGEYYKGKGSANQDSNEAVAPEIRAAEQGVNDANERPGEAREEL